ncbi:MAG: helix-turn-helix domain-containing protein [Streptosporangiales bacterium]|nr:helix-turn-helix domain-containing protein [Streptosporangiales bacterium]
MSSSVAPLRKARGLTQQELARLAGVSRQTVVELERGDYNPSAALALRLAVLLGASVEELFQLPGDEIESLRAQMHRHVRDNTARAERRR